MRNEGMPLQLCNLVTELRSDAERCGRDRARVDGKAVFSRIATDIEAAWREWWLEPITIARAAHESGYSEDHLRDLVRQRRIPDNRPQGSRGEIRFPRHYCPRKPPEGPAIRCVGEELAETIIRGRKR